MRFASLVSILALILAALGSPAQQLCGLGAPAGTEHSASVYSCCGATECCPSGHCSCSMSSRGDTDEKSVAVPSSFTVGSMLCVAAVATTDAPVDAGATARILPIAPRGPTPGHAFCRSNRAPPQS